VIELRAAQGEDEWWELRRGIPTGSQFSRIITAEPVQIEVPIDEAQAILDSPATESPVWNGMALSPMDLVQLKADCDKPRGNRKYARFTGYRESTSQDAYACELIAAMMGWESRFTGTPDTEYGIHLEGQARNWLKVAHNLKVDDCGFFLSDCGLYGASPDGMTSEGWPVEIKCPDLHTFIKWKDRGELPGEHKAQVHGEMFVTGASKCIFVAYADPMHPLEAMMIEVERDDFTERLGQCVINFTKKLRRKQMAIIRDPEQFIAARDAERQALIDKILKPVPVKPETLHQVMNRVGREAAHEHH
jgi:hypothetical protein